MKNKIVYDGRTFEATNIKSGQIHLASSLPSMKLEPNTFTAVVKSEDKSLTEFTRNTPLYYYHRDRLVCISYVQTVDRIGPNKYKFYGTSAIGRLIEQSHAGGIYTGQTAEEIIKDICGQIPVAIKQNLKGINLYGWLPYANPPERSARDNLLEVLFAIGATVKVGADETIKVENFWDGISRTTERRKIYTGASVNSASKITQVVVTEHQYVPVEEETKLFDGTAQHGDLITFSEPAHHLRSAEFVILDSGANWAKISAGTGTLFGKKYFHSTRQLSRPVENSTVTSGEKNIKSINDATMISLVNSMAAARRMADYYKCRERLTASVIYQGELPGDRNAIYHPFDKTGVDACVESADINISNTLKATEKSLIGFVPHTAEAVEIFDEMQIITESGSIVLPDGVTEGRFVLISGGQGGQAGYNGDSGNAGTSARTSGGTQYGSKGIGGSGGSAGAGGAGGNVYVGVFTIDSGDILRVEIGTGGAGGASNGAPGSKGGATKLTIGSVVYSSDDGSSSDMGYTDVVTGKTYATQGTQGINGAKGGNGEDRSQVATSGASLGGYSGGGTSTRSISSSSKSTTERTGPKLSQNTVANHPPEVTESMTKEGASSYTIGSDGTIKLGTTRKTIGKYLSNNVFKYIEGTVYTSANNPAAPTSGSGTVRVTSYVVSYTCSASNQSGVSNNKCKYTWHNVLSYRDYTFTKYTIQYGYGTLGSGGGGAALGNSGGSASTSGGGSGASASAPSPATVPGNGGNGGNGGGGGGGGGAGAAEVTGDYNKISYTANGSGGFGGSGGRGSAGGRGAPGLLILYYGVPKIIRPGQLVDKNNKMVLDRLGRRIIM